MKIIRGGDKRGESNSFGKKRIKPTVPSLSGEANSIGRKRTVGSGI